MVFVNALFITNHSFIILTNLLGNANVLFCAKFSYAPILGASSYLTFITGNIMNLKLPSVMTIVILALAALLTTQISPLFELPSVKKASGYITPALFGSLTPFHILIFQIAQHHYSAIHIYRILSYFN